MAAAPDLPPVVHIPARARAHVYGRAAAPPAATAVVTDGARCLRPVVSIVDRPDGGGSLDARPSVRLTVRGRMVLGASTVLTALALVLIAWSSAPASAGASPSRGGAVADQPGRPAVVVVQSGDSLWSIAQRLAPGSDPRSVVARLARLNKLADGAQLVPGQQLRTG